jgi:hypothetical protein
VRVRLAPRRKSECRAHETQLVRPRTRSTTLDELQRQFLAQQADFVRSFNTRATRLPGMSRRPADQRRWAVPGPIWITGTLGVLLLRVGAVGGRTAARLRPPAI